MKNISMLLLHINISRIKTWTLNL